MGTTFNTAIVADILMFLTNYSDSVRFDVAGHFDSSSLVEMIQHKRSNEKVNEGKFPRHLLN